MRNVFFYLIFISFLSVTNPVEAFNFALGANLSQQELSIFHKNNGGKEVAILQGEYKISPMLAINSSPQYFGNTRFGWEIEFNIGILNLDQQKVDSTSKNLGTKINGAFGHFNPTIIYRFGDKQQKGTRRWSLTGGLGYGLSYLILDGNFKETDRKSGSQQSVKVDQAQGAFLLPSLFLEGVWHNWFTSISSCFGGNGLEVDGYTYKLLINSVNFGYRFTF